MLGIGIFFLPDLGSVLHLGYRVWDVFVMIFGVYAIFHLLKVYLHKLKTDVFLMLLAGIPILVFGFHDILVINHLADRRDGLIMQFSVIPSVALFSWFLVRRFVSSISEAESLARTLEKRVESKQNELQVQYEKLKFMEKENVLAEERERIMRDMHDGIGGQLVSVILLLQEQSGGVFKHVRDKIELSLSDLRFVINSLDPMLNDIPTLLGVMRMPMEEQLKTANICLEWAVTDLPKIESLNPRNSLNIMRIEQEAVTNIIKHANTKHVTVATGVEDGKIFIDIIDYGKGLNSNYPAENNMHARGVKNMEHRAQQLKGSLAIKTSKEGGSVRLLIGNGRE